MLMPSPPLPDVAEAAAQLSQDTDLLSRTREQARSALLFAQLGATQEEGRLLGRALDALDEAESLPTSVYLVSRAYLHAGRVMRAWSERAGDRQRPGLSTHAERAQEWEQREQFLRTVSECLSGKS